MNRLEGWEHRLAAIEAELQLQPWEWGAHDCGTVAVAVVEALTGKVPTIELTALQRSRLAARGVEEYADAAAAELGLVPEPNQKQLRRGDPCLVREGDRLALGFVSTRGRPAVAAPEGLLELPRSEIVKGWRII